MRAGNGILLCMLLALVACEPGGARELDLAQLAAQQSAYNGRAVVTAGTLRTHDTPLHFWIEDGSFNRVALEYSEDVSALVGRQLTVRGTFRYAAERGRWIEVEQLSAR